MGILLSFETDFFLSFCTLKYGINIFKVLSDNTSILQGVNAFFLN